MEDSQESEDDKSAPSAGYQQPNNGGILVSFPLILQRMLDKLKAECDSNTIS
jgi:hypothetical protein